MILQALTRLYEDLAARGEIARPGWGHANISYALCVDSDGALTQVIPQMHDVVIGKKTVLRPRAMELPAAVKRSSGIASNFLWDSSAYLFGVDAKGKPERAKDCFRACAALHHELLDEVDCPTAKAILNFFDNWQPETAPTHPALSDVIDDVLKGANLVFRVNGVYAQDDPLIRDAWQSHYDQREGKTMQCLVSGCEDVVETVHPAIKGVSGAQMAGAALVSFNAPAFCSYGRDQGMNAPIGKSAAFAYTSALNHLLSKRDSVQRIGDTTVLCWAEGADPVHTDFGLSVLFGLQPPQGLTNDDLHAAVKRLAQGLPCEALSLDPNRPFYILGLAPNAARLSVRFFLRNTFGELMRNVNAHYERLEMVGNSDHIPSLWRLLSATVNQKATDKSPSPVMAGAVARAVFSGTAYPAALLEAVMLRIRAERNITADRAAILKAYYLKNTDPACPKEVLTVSLNESSTNIPYTLGRLFAVYEALQEAANPGINATIRDKYYSSAASTPAYIFPILDNLAGKHLRKLDGGLKVHYDRQITELKSVLPEQNPLRLTLPEQGAFYLGYYHQKQSRYQKKEEK